MTDRPIIFSAPMVRALLDGRKTMTRRLAWKHWLEDGTGGYVLPDGHTPSSWQRVQPGDRLWVRENFIGARGYDSIPPKDWCNKPIWLCADGEPDRKLWWHLSDKARPSIHMPRWASRLTLTVTAVKVERLHYASAADLYAEGLRPATKEKEGIGADEDLYSQWIELWDSLHGPGAWDANPEVVAITFAVQQRNIDHGR